MEKIGLKRHYSYLNIIRINLSVTPKTNAMKTNSTLVKTAFFLLAVMMISTSCKEDPVAPTVTLDEQSAVVSYDKAWLFADITSNGGAEVTERGFCFGIAGGEPDQLVMVEGDNRFSGELSGLAPSTTYTCKAFAGNEAGRGYSAPFTFTTLNDTIPVVVTCEVKEVTYHSAVVSGQVLSGGGHEITDRGICYSLSALPTVNDSCLSAGSGVGPFEIRIEGLSPVTRYYYRAYAVCSLGTFYGNQEVVDTDVLPMAVHTIGVSNVTATRAKAAGIVIRDGGYDVTECGFCWGTQHEPTLEGMHIKAGFGLEEFSCYIGGFERGVTHYLRSYSINEKGVAYGEEVAFLPDDAWTSWPGGTLPGLFSVAPGRQVRFSQGNLQYYPDDNLWRFAEKQWDYVGGSYDDEQQGKVHFGTVYAHGAKCDNTKANRYYEGWMDLFGWGTSGWNNGNVYYHPYDFAACEYHCASYGPPGNYDLTGDYAEADWGVHNHISNGGSRQWRTITVDELLYLLTERETPSGMRFTKAVVYDICGMILLPDDWDASIYPLNAVNVHEHYNRNVISASDWMEVLEPAGAVFLPAGGERYQFPLDDGIIYDHSVIVPSILSPASYWTTTQGGVNIANALCIYAYELPLIAGCVNAEAPRCNGCSVRLISDE